MFIDANGGVGIGAPSTSTALSLDINRRGPNVRLNIVRDQPGDGGYASFVAFDATNNFSTMPNAQIGVTGSVNLGSNPALTRFYIGLNGADYTTATHFVIVPDGAGGARVGIGTMTPTERLHVNGSVLATSYQQTSSRRWKTDIRPLEGASDLVARLRGVRFAWREDGRADVGLIAEEVGAVVPEVVTFSADGVNAESVDYARLVAVLVEAVKEELARAETLERRVDALEASARAASSSRRSATVRRAAARNGR